MIVAKDHTWILYTPPKTGSTTLHKVLTLPPVDAVNVLGQHSVECHVEAIKIATIRHPVTRAMSLWRHLIYQFRHGGDRIGFQSEPSFDEFVERLNDNVYNDFFGWPISKWLKGIKIDRYVMFEHFKRDVEDCFKITLNEHLNSTVKLYGIPRFSTNSLNIIEKWAAEDFDKFGYSPSDIEQVLNPSIAHSFC